MPQHSTSYGSWSSGGRNAGAIRALDEVAEMGDEEEQRATLEALMTSIDEEPLSSRRRFR